ncbi:MAG: class I adenylate-forming enzyme family protein [Candidatus Omnitrophota bacterium]
MDTIRLLLDNAKRYPDKPALFFADEVITFSQLRDNVFAVADGLRQKGVLAGDRVGLYLPNCPEYVYSYLALFCLRAVAVPLDFMLSREELVNCLAHCRAKALIAADKGGDFWQDISKDVPSLSEVVFTRGKDLFGRARAGSSEGALSGKLNAEGNADDLALILYTSGSSGRPKGVMLSYRHLGASPRAMRYFVDLSDKDIKICCLPLSHSGGLVYIQNMLSFALSLVLMERFSPLKFLGNIERYKVTCFHIVPSMYYAILRLKQFEKYDLATLRWVVVFGAPSAAEDLRRFRRHCPQARLLNGWGLTETCPPNTVLPLDSDRIESVGLPAPWVEIRLVDESGRDVKPGETGEIVLKSWVVMQGYYRNPEDTREALRDGWFYTGDLGRFDAQGFLYIAGRRKDVIKVSGQLVYAPEVEAALQSYPEISEAAVIGVADNLRGEAIKALVVGNNGAIKEDDLREFCRRRLAHFKIPHYIEFVDNLPKTGSGKIDKGAIRRAT